MLTEQQSMQSSRSLTDLVTDLVTAKNHQLELPIVHRTKLLIDFQVEMWVK